VLRSTVFSRRLLVLWAPLCLAVLSGSAALADPGLTAHPPRPLPFASGERLTYSITWLALRAGTAVMEADATSPVRERPAVKLISTARSTPFVSKFFPVENRVESVFDLGQLVPQRMIFHRREGRRKNDFDVTFRHAEGTVTSIKDGVEKTLAIPPETQDALSCLYYLRSLPALVPGSSRVFNVHHDQKNYRLEIRVESLDKVAAPWGEVEALRILAIMPFQGIFLNEGNIRVWLTNDARRVPLQMKAKVIIGSVVASLTEATGISPSR